MATQNWSLYVLYVDSKWFDSYGILLCLGESILDVVQVSLVTLELSIVDHASTK